MPWLTAISFSRTLSEADSPNPGPAVPFQYVLPGARIICPIVEIRSGG